jgi:hypothetical protein
VVVSKAAASFSKPTVWTLHSAQMNILKNFIRAKFIFPAKFLQRIAINCVLL